MTRAKRLARAQASAPSGAGSTRGLFRSVVVAGGRLRGPSAPKRLAHSRDNPASWGCFRLVASAAAPATRSRRSRPHRSRGRRPASAVGQDSRAYVERQGQGPQGLEGHLTDCRALRGQIWARNPRRTSPAPLGSFAWPSATPARSRRKGPSTNEVFILLTPARAKVLNTGRSLPGSGRREARTKKRRPGVTGTPVGKLGRRGGGDPVRLLGDDRVDVEGRVLGAGKAPPSGPPPVPICTPTWMIWVGSKPVAAKAGVASTSSRRSRRPRSSGKVRRWNSCSRCCWRGAARNPS